MGELVFEHIYWCLFKMLREKKIWKLVKKGLMGEFMLCIVNVYWSCKCGFVLLKLIWVLLQKF